MGKRTTATIFRSIVVTALSAFLTAPVFAQVHSRINNLLQVGDTVVRRILPKPESDSLYVATDYTEIHFKLNKADLDISYMDNGMALLHLDHVIDSLGIENITAIEIISQSSPEGSLERNTWLTEHRSQVMMYYMNRVFPELKSKISFNKVTESWENLDRYVAQDPLLSDETKQNIYDIIDARTISVAAKKVKLKKNLGTDPAVGDVYAYLTKYYYPVIRNSGIYILHMVEPEPEIELEPSRPYIVETTPSPEDFTFEPEPMPGPPVHKRPILAVKTNMLYNAFFTKNLGWAPIWNVELELYPNESGRWTCLAEYEFPWHVDDKKHQYLQILNLQLEARRYFKKASHHTGHYLSAYIGANLFDICFDSELGHGYQGEGYGGGLGYGYVLPLGNRSDTKWKLEFFLKGGLYIAYHDPYDAGSPYEGKYYYEWYDSPTLFIKRNMVFRWLNPTGVGVTLSYDLINKTVRKKDKQLSSDLTY